MRVISREELLSEIKRRIVEWDYTSQSGMELMEFIEGVSMDIPYVYVTEDFWNNQKKSELCKN